MDARDTLETLVHELLLDLLDGHTGAVVQAEQELCCALSGLHRPGGREAAAAAYDRMAAAREQWLAEVLRVRRTISPVAEA